jgi:hypothetical protein
MKWAALVVGIVLVLMGCVWALQGLNVLRQGFMAGHLRWTVIGGVLVVVGLVLTLTGILWRKPTGGS